MNLIHSTAALGRGFITMITGLGAFARLFGAIMARSSILWRRTRLTAQQVHFIGNHSLLIIGVSGLFVGFVLGLQGYYTLNRYGSEEALGKAVARRRKEFVLVSKCGQQFDGLPGGAWSAAVISLSSSSSQ